MKVLSRFPFSMRRLLSSLEFKRKQSSVEASQNVYINVVEMINAFRHRGVSLFDWFRYFNSVLFNIFDNSILQRY